MSAKRFIIIDYGSGNLHSIKKACERAVHERKLSVDVCVSSETAHIESADALILPGVGAFADCVAGLHAVPGLRNALERKVREQHTPFLGICVGMQMLASHGYEHGRHEGLGWIDADIIPFTPGPRSPSPHIGWSTLSQRGNHALANTLNGQDVYFVHSYYMYPKDTSWIQAEAEYAGVRFPALVARDNICAMQFHPEKSHDAGIAALGDFFILATESS